ncbi:MAG: extracellular solute-binding protein [Acidimicrobiales bacterium]
MTAARHRRSSLAVALVVALATGSLLTSAPAASAQSGSIVLYNGQHEQTALTMVSEFEHKTGITVQVRNDTEDSLADQVVTEGSRSPADVIWTENSPALEYLQKKKLLSKVDASILSKVPRRYSSPEGDWVGVSARVSVLIYDPSLISRRQLPTRVLELASPRYKGKLALAAGETDFQPIVTSVVRAYGKARALSWLKGMKENAAGHVYTSNETIADEVNRGEVAFGLVNQYYWYRMRAEIGRSRVHSKIAYFAPRDPGYVLDVSAAGVLESSRQKKAAQEFLAYIVSKQGQQIIADPSKSISFEYPIGSHVETKAGERPFDQLRPYPISIAELGDGSTAISLLRKAGLL